MAPRQKLTSHPRTLVSLSLLSELGKIDSIIVTHFEEISTSRLSSGLAGPRPRSEGGFVWRKWRR